MLRVNLVVACLLMSISLLTAQQEERIRFIEVNGEAKVEVVPDEIYVNGTINEDKQETFDKVEKKFLANLKKAGVASKDVNLADMNGEFAKAWFKKNQMTKVKTYQVKLTSTEQVGEFLKMADEAGLKNVNIVRTDISNRKEVERKLRIAAIKDAKEKAGYMAEAIDTELGAPLQVREQYLNLFVGNNRVRGLAEADAMNLNKVKLNSMVVGFKKIRMEMKVNARFELK